MRFSHHFRPGLLLKPLGVSAEGMSDADENLFQVTQAGPDHNFPSIIHHSVSLPLLRIGLIWFPMRCLKKTETAVHLFVLLSMCHL